MIHTRGALLEETHYYPFGLPMAGISAKAAWSLESKKKFNGIEYSKEYDLNLLDAFYRSGDPQIGRWWQLDPRPSMSETLYSMMGNNPILKSDMLGDTTLIDDNGVVTRNDMNGDGLLFHPY